MTNLSKLFCTAAVVASSIATTSFAEMASHEAVSDDVISHQRAELAEATDGAGFGPQSPRDIDVAAGNNHRAFGTSPEYTQMNLCNIHFHENAEHKGGQFTNFAGNGDGHGYGTGYTYSGTLTDDELKPFGEKVGDSDHGDLISGDTIEIHFVHSSAQVTPGPTLGSCISDAIKNPQLRVETVVAVLVNDPAAADLTEMAQITTKDDLQQAAAIPSDLGDPVIYTGSTTGPGYNEKASPFQVTWSVRPEVAKIDIASVARWLDDNPFDEDHAHGVRNLVTNPELLSPIMN